MKQTEQATLLRIYLSESDRWHGRPLYEQIVLKARELGLAGATVLRGIMGFGAGSRVHTTKIERLAEDLPVVIEIVDSAERLALLTPLLDERLADGLVTMEEVRVARYRAR